MPRHVRQKGRPNRSKRRGSRKRQYLNYGMILRDIQTQAALEKMTASETNERRHKHCLL